MTPKTRATVRAALCVLSPLGQGNHKGCPYVFLSSLPTAAGRETSREPQRRPHASIQKPAPSIQNYGAEETQRKPKKLRLRLSGTLLKRSAARTNHSSTYHEPPRTTR